MKKLSLLLLIKAFVLVALVTWSQIGLSPDEAQYWTWSQHLSSGYYSKPPGIAWQIASGTFLLGNTEWGVRLFAQVIGFLFPLLIYQIACAAGFSSRQAFFAGLVTAFSPLGWLSSLLAITDGGLIVFWCIALYLLIEKEGPNYLLIGVCIALGALFKWPIYWFWIFVIAAIPLVPRLKKGNLFSGIALSLLGLLPSIFWNMKHSWVTFRHVEATVVAKDLQDVGATMLMKGNFWDFVGAQAALFSPILFLLFCFAAIVAASRWKELSESLKICFIFSVIPLTLFAIAALFKKMQGNWCQFAYPGAFILIIWVSKEKWLKWGLALSCFLVMIIFLIPGLQRDGLPIPYKLNPFKHNVGWNNLSTQLSAAGYDESSHFLFADKYQTTAILWFYGPGQHPSYFLNLQQLRLNQFSFWPGMAEKELGKTGYFVLVENEPHLSRQKDTWMQKLPTQLENYFEKVEFSGIYPLFGESKQAMVWKCIGYNGKEPAHSDKY